ncbi:nicotinate phosphoribosyltransferase [Pectobacterium phage POP12]|nr:nicotinate phosphoribosyltransferase [Pectobacterium phage POP12]
MNISLYQNNSIISSVDSYKASHWVQYPDNAEEVQFYIESRGGKFDEIVTAGANYIKSALSVPVTVQQVEFMNLLFKKHFGREIFNYQGWLDIAKLGYTPVKFSSLPEGTPVNPKTVVAALHAKRQYLWIAGWLETMALRGVWYPSTVATLSRECKKVLNKYLSQTSDLTGVDYDIVLGTRLHDFGARGVSSSESAAIGGLAHLYNFIGTDTVEALMLSMSLFGIESVDDWETSGVSIPAREHSTTISYGKENEDAAYKNSIQIFGDSIYACVYDSYDYKAAVNRISEYKDEILAKGGTLVVRPDSGDMIDNIMYTLETLGKIFGYTVNSKGYKVLHRAVRIIQGDEIHGPETIERVLSWIETNRWSSENIAFGMGGGLLQSVTRDDQKYAMKMCCIKIDGIWYKTYKCPKGSEWKASKKGFLTTIVKDGVYKTIDLLEQPIPLGWKNAMVDYYDHGVVYNEDTLGIIRGRASI